MTDSLALKLEGSIKRPWVDELQKAWSASAGTSPRKPVEVDLAGVSFIDATGRDLLLQMQQAGTVLVGASPFLRYVLDGNAGKPRKSNRN
jgi:ABC-type transporter Mla MlaB component